jgi:hydroxysqualene dehydroxylase
MSQPRVHVIGAGLAGLSAAMVLVEAGRAVSIHEAGPAAGGRCRSYFDRTLDCRVDNGNHLMLSGNRATMAYLDRIGARLMLGGPGAPLFPFMDLASGERWSLRPNTGRVPWWIFSRARRVPGTQVRDYLGLVALRRVRDDAPVAEVLRDNTLYRRLLAPLAIAALNTPPEQALARLLAAVVDETLALGGAACIPCVPRHGLSETFVDPALAWLGARGVDITFGRRILGLSIEAGGVVGLRTPEGPIALSPGDAVVLAVPPWVAVELLPGLVAPDEFQAIVNVHFRIAPKNLPGDLARTGFLGLIGGVAEWVFAKSDHVSVTISAANRMADQSAEEIAAATWPDVRRALDLPAEMPVWRVVKERRATFAATSVQERRRPGARTALENLALAGDWTATGLPATIEGAIRSGRIAAECLRAAS